MVRDVKETVGIILAGGRGERAKPITLESADHIRSKALIPLAGRRLIEWVVDACREQGIRRFFVVAQGLENRSQIKAVLGHGERHGVEVRYSRPRFDRYNVGSGAATLHNVEQWDLQGNALVLPVDSLFDFSLPEMLSVHEERRALVTVAAVEREPEEIAGKYGVMVTEPDGWVTSFEEKPGLARMQEIFPDSLRTAGQGLPTNAGMYLVDCGRLRAVARRPPLLRLAYQRLDWGGDLLPWLVRHGAPVTFHPIRTLGDLGNVQDYLDTLTDVLAGRYPQISTMLGEPTSERPRYWIHETSLRTTDDLTGTTLAQKIAEGSVHIGEGVRIGRHVTIGEGVRLAYCDIGDGADLREGARLERTFCGDAAMIGPCAWATDSYIGPMAEVQSEAGLTTRLNRYTAVGDGARLAPGSRLEGVRVYPRLAVPPLDHVPFGTELTSSNDVLRWVS